MNFILYTYNMPTKRKKKLKKKNKTKRGLGGYLKSHEALYNLPDRGPKWRSGAIPWTTLIKVQDLYLYGSSLPIWGSINIRDVLKYYLFRKDIKSIISLQGCGSEDIPEINLSRCGTPADEENYMFGLIKRSDNLLRNDPFVYFLDYPIEDMTAGDMDVWENIAIMNVSESQRSTLFHCYAGFGRTGSILLFFILAHFGNVTDICTKPYMGTNSSIEMYELLKTLLNTHIQIAEDETNEIINERIKHFYIEYFIDEVLNYSILNSANLLITRINYIILMLAYRNNYEEDSSIYLYHIITPDRLHYYTEGSSDLFVPIEVNYNDELDDIVLVNSEFAT